MPQACMAKKLINRVVKCVGGPPNLPRLLTAPTRFIAQAFKIIRYGIDHSTVVAENVGMRNAWRFQVCREM